MARRKKEEVVEEVKVVTEEIKKPAEKPEIKATVKKATKKKSVKIKAPRVNIRKSPSLMGDVVTIALAGDKFDLVNAGDDGFYEVTCNGETAYIMKDFAELV